MIGGCDWQWALWQLAKLSWRWIFGFVALAMIAAWWFGHN